METAESSVIHGCHCNSKTAHAQLELNFQPNLLNVNGEYSILSIHIMGGVQKSFTFTVSLEELP